MSREKAEKAEKDRVKTARKVQEKADKAERNRAKTAGKVQEKADKAEKDRVKTARQTQEKADKAERTEKDRVESARQSGRARTFDEFLNQASLHSKGCCEPCSFYVETSNGEYQPCRLGHEDSGPNKEICTDCTDTRYRPKK